MAVGQADEAITQFGQALELLTELQESPNGRVDVLRAHNNFANFRLLLAQNGLGNHAFQMAAGVDQPISNCLLNLMEAREQYEAALKRREQEIREELGSENETNWERLAALEKALAVVMERLQNPETSLARAKTELAGAAQALDRLKHDVQVPDLDQAKQALARGETASAEDLLVQTLAAGKEQAGEAAFQLGELARHRIDYLKAYEYYLEAVRLQPRNPHYLSKAAEILYDLGRYGEAMPFLKQSLAIRKEMYGTMHPNVAQCLNHLAGVHLAQGEYAEAESLYKESLAMRKKFFGSEHPTVAESLNNLGQLYYEQGQYAAAEQLYQQALAIYEKTLGHPHSEVATVLNNLANLYQAQSLYAKAKMEYEEALTIDEKQNTQHD